LTSIGGLARRVRENLSEKDRNKKYLDLIIQEVTRLEGMVKDLVELKTTAVSYKEKTDIHALISDALNGFRENCEQEGIDINTDMSDGTPTVSADKEQLKLALGSLFENAIEAMASSPSKRLTVKSDLEDDRVNIDIRDTGRGIPKEKIKNIFDPFFTSKTSGPGLGLTLASKIIQEHRGSISVESEPEQGTCVTVSLPVKRM